MYDLETIVARNREAARKGNIKAGELYGTKGVKAQPVIVVHIGSGIVIDRCASDAKAATKYRQGQRQGEVAIHDDNGQEVGEAYQGRE